MDRVVLRSWAKTGAFTGFALPWVARPPWGVGFAAAMVTYTWWRRVVADATGLRIRNARTYAVPWADVARVKLEDPNQLLPRWLRWFVEHRGVSRDGRTLVVRRHDGRATPANALVHGFLAEAFSTSDADRAVPLLRAGLQAARAGKDPVAAMRALDRPPARRAASFAAGFAFWGAIASAVVLNA